MSRTAIAYAGLPGAGKSEAARIGQSLIGGSRDSMGQAMRRAFQTDTNETATSESLGEYATNFRKNHGPGGLAERMIMEWGYQGGVDSLMHIDGLRCVEEIRVFSEFFDQLEILFIDAPEGTRLSRLTSRSRDGESTFQIADLRKRDAREYGWGVAAVKAHDSTFVLQNTDSFQTLENQISSVFTNGVDL